MTYRVNLDLINDHLLHEIPLNTPREILHDRIKRIGERIHHAAERGQRQREDITLVVVTKGSPPEIFPLLKSLNVRHVAENRAQTAAQRLASHRDHFTTHFIGQLQTNKTRKILAVADVLHSVDSLPLLQRLDRQSQELDIQPEVFLQLNISGDPSRSGMAPDDARQVLSATDQLRSVVVTGFMGMSHPAHTPEETRVAFASLREKRDQLAQEMETPLPHLSMGMSRDFEIAIEEGATIIRVGTLLLDGLFDTPPATSPLSE